MKFVKNIGMLLPLQSFIAEIFFQQLPKKHQSQLILNSENQDKQGQNF